MKKQHRQKNNKGPRTEPCGTPQVKEAMSE